MPRRSRVSSTRLRMTVGRDGQLLHAVGQLLLDGVGDESGEGILADHPDHVGQLTGRVGPGVPPVHGHPPGQGPAGEVGHEPVDGAEQGGLAHAGASHHQGQLALVDCAGTRPGGPAGGARRR